MTKLAYVSRYQRQIDVIRETGEGRIKIEREHTNEAVDATRELLINIIEERETRYEQRFAAQEQAVKLALDRVDKEFHEHIRSVREETSAALMSADKAILKSEVSIEKRFDGFNATRQQLADQASSFMPRKEADVRMDALTEKIDTNAERMNTFQLQLSSRLDLTQGQTTGGKEAVQEKRASNSAVYATIGFGLSLLFALITVVTLVISSRM